MHVARLRRIKRIIVCAQYIVFTKIFIKMNIIPKKD